MKPQTHLSMDRTLSGRPIELAEDRAVLELETLPSMRADAFDLVHGGFIFSLADHAAMLAINHPNVVLGAAQTRFLKPVVVGDTVTAEAVVDRREGKKIFVHVSVKRDRDGDADEVMSGEFTCFTPPKHVLAPAPPKTDDDSVFKEDRV